MLRVIDLSKVYNGNVVLRGINLEVEGFVGILVQTAVASPHF